MLRSSEEVLAGRAYFRLRLPSYLSVDAVGVFTPFLAEVFKSYLKERQWIAMDCILSLKNATDFFSNCTRSL